MSKHTPGPWQIGTPSGHNVALVYSKSGEAVASVFGLPLNTRIDDVSGDRWQEGLATARLISAAPDLLSAIKTLVFIAEGDAAAAGAHPMRWAALRVGQAAIAKAEGTDAP